MLRRYVIPLDMKYKYTIAFVNVLTEELKLTEFGIASPPNGWTKEDERSAALAARAQRGDYDDGISPNLFLFVVADTNIFLCRTYTRAVGTESSIFEG